MPAWTLTLKRSVLDDLRRLPKDARGRAAIAVLELCDSPLRPGVEKLRGYSQIFRLRVGDYRILYEISGSEVVVLDIRNRKDVYRQLGH